MASLLRPIEKRTHSSMTDSTATSTTDESPFGSSLTTPVDERSQPFVVLSAVVEHTSSSDPAETTPKPEQALGEKSDEGPATPKSSTPISKIKQFALALVKSKKGSPSSPLLSYAPASPTIASKTISRVLGRASPKSVAGVGGRRKRLFSLPNESIEAAGHKTEERSFANVSPELQSGPDVSVSHGDAYVDNVEIDPIPPPRSSSLLVAPSTSQPLIAITETAELEIESTVPTISPPCRLWLSAVPKIFFFLPWCVAVGATIALSPRHLDLVAFSPGYLPTTPHGIRRFAHWADVAMHHVAIFFAFTAAVGWYVGRQFGPVVWAVVLAQAVLAWQGFRPDENMPLGEDDMQSVWIVATKFACGPTEDTVMIKRPSGGFVFKTAKSWDVAIDGQEA